MAESHEPSYYEIALTNRQVVVAFVILLTCLLSAFFSGVWIGRESTARAAEEQIVRNTPPPAPKEGQNLEELEFFDSRKGNAGETQEPPKSTEAAAPSENSTLVEDVSGRRSEPEPGVQGPAEEEPAASAATATQPAPKEDSDANLTRAERRERRRREKEEAAKQARAETPEPTPAATRTTTARVKEPVVPKGSVVIQVFSSSDQAQADRIRTQLTGGGYKAYLSPVEKAGHTMYRVRIGPFSSRDDAQKVAEKVRKGYKLDTWVTE